jgi:hypothetical protein
MCLNGVFVAIELKAKSNDRPSKLQEWNLQGVLDAGGLAYTATPENWNLVYALLQDLSQYDYDESQGGRHDRSHVQETYIK